MSATGSLSLACETCPSRSTFRSIISLDRFLALICSSSVMEDKHRSSSLRRYGTTESSSFSLYRMQMSGKEEWDDEVKMCCRTTSCYIRNVNERDVENVCSYSIETPHVLAFVRSHVSRCSEREWGSETENVSQTDAWLFATRSGCLDLKNVFERKTEPGAMTFFSTQRRITRRFFFIRCGLSMIYVSRCVTYSYNHGSSII